jgi:protein N-terminal asparagine amidohydrolase
MVFHTSDSTNTLVSLDNDGHKQLGEQQNNLQQEQRTESLFDRTELHVPNSRCDHQHHCPRLHVPADAASRNVDDFLPGVASLRESCEELLLGPVRHFDANTPSRVLYVQQGERANATARDCDVLVSDRATTCHILALYSHGDTVPLASLTHLDGTSYEACISQMLRDHVKEENKRDLNNKVTIDVHIMGGFNDSDGTSASITNWLLHLLAQIAEETKRYCRMILKTCAVTTMNDTGYASPIGRGLGISLKTGRVFLAKCDAAVAGPVPLLRNIRLWAKSHHNRLSVIHDSSHSSTMVVEPFGFSEFDDISFLLSLPDDALIQYTSTSPDVEEADFCTSIRASLRFLQRQRCQHFFGRKTDQPLVFERVGTNGWKQLSG